MDDHRGDFIRAARRHFDEREMVRIDVPEWGQTVHVKLMTVEEQLQIFRADKGALDDEAAALNRCVKIIMLKALDVDGNPVMRSADEKALRNGVDSQVLARVATEILEASTPERPEKN